MQYSLSSRGAAVPRGLTVGDVGDLSLGEAQTLLFSAGRLPETR